MRNRREAAHGLAKFALLIVLVAGGGPSLGVIPATVQNRVVRFPETPAGRAVTAYFKAFNSGEKAMRAFLEKFSAKEALQKTPIPVRLEMYLRTRAQVGDLEIQKVIQSRPDFISVGVRTRSGQLLELSFEFEPTEPHGLLEILCIESKTG